ncbi:baeRF7 domain-containing protein [Phormidium sp. CCY1219]|uniref:baeRF7 domain-containing protein n=1 Tax=Phormidium sp. CCY1219 TaxID=2886104 RepID=UPI002D1EE936|nr:hypothetical protein [Phormidium sp. CCY1219]MEB3827704.1 hypothetical protein [Phormidium sp. CCY1219]
MDFFSKDELKNLIENTQTPCVSIYMPTPKRGSETQQSPIRFKNLMTEVEQKLDAIGIRVSDAMEWLQPVKDLDTPDFWEHQEHGLAIFASPDRFVYYRVPLEVEELAVVGDRFHLKPLMPLLTKNGRFFILALSQHNVRLLEATQYNVREMHVEDVPESLEEALLYDETAKSGQFRFFTSRGGTRNPAQERVSHGQGSPDRDKFQRDIAQYFHQVNEAIAQKLHDEDAPLVLAGDESILPIYHEANSYSHLLEKGIAGNPKLLKPEELQKWAWQVVQPEFEQAYHEAVSKYEELVGSPENHEAFSQLQDIVPAAYYKRLDSLFVAVDRHQWGQFDPNTNTVDIHESPQPNDEDLLDFAAVYTFLNGGTVYAEPRDRVPGNAPVAAIARYSVAAAQ